VGRAAPVHQLPVTALTSALDSASGAAARSASGAPPGPGAGSAPSTSAGLLVLLIALLGALAGIGLAVLTDAVSRSDVGGTNWSLRGNGALLVPFSSVPAILVGGWVSLARLRVRDRHWGQTGLIAGSVMFLIGALTVFSPVVAVGILGADVLRGPGDARSAVALKLVSFVLPVVLASLCGFSLAAWFARITRRSVAYFVGILIALAALQRELPGELFLFYGPTTVLSLLVALPTIVGSEAQRPPLIGRLWLVLACIALPIGLASGLVLTEIIQGR
jgi:hypothetical protein